MQSHALTVQDAFQPIPGLINCTGVTGRWGLLSHAQNAIRWLTLSIQQILKRSVHANLHAQHAMQGVSR